MTLPNLASRISRLLAYCIDLIILIPVMAIVSWLTGGWTSLAAGELSLSSYWLTALVSLAVFILVNGRLLLEHGQTWGKRMMGIRIASLAGTVPEKSQLAKRYLFYWGVPLLPLIGWLLEFANILFIFSGSRRCLHDRFAETVVLRV